MKKEPRTIKVATLFVMLMTGMALVGGIIVLRWAYAPSTALVINNAPAPTKPVEVKGGEKVFMEVDFCKTTDAEGHTTVYLIGEQGAKISINWPIDRSAKGCTFAPEVPVPIPGQTPTDTYHLEFTTCYDINPLKQDKCTAFTSQNFQVNNAKLNAGDARVR